MLFLCNRLFIFSFLPMYLFELGSIQCCCNCNCLLSDDDDDDDDGGGGGDGDGGGDDKDDDDYNACARLGQLVRSLPAN